MYERDGWRVTYHGILKGLEDFGRDLVCVKGDDIHIVQCKCWSQDKLVREKHVFQLFGTTILFKLQNEASRTGGREGAGLRFVTAPKVTPVFATTTNLSPEATAVAQYLDVVVRTEPLRRYSMIKCNVNAATHERIFHLPFDQQYDHVVIGNVPGEFYAETVLEAEAKGFRRAFRWHPPGSQVSE